MQNKNTVGELIQLAIQAERKSEEFYIGLSDKFSAYPDLAEFWKRYALEEEGHARWLENLNQRFPAEQFEDLANADILEKARKMSEFQPEHELEKVNDLQDAFDLANEFEHSETNVVFETLIQHFAKDQHTQTFLRNQLREHVSKLAVDFPVQYNQPAIRRAILAKKAGG